MRSPIGYPLSRGDGSAGGDAELQTDVMRFMAILALCLVAIFALVQSIPLAPQAPTEEAVTAARTPQASFTDETASTRAAARTPADAPAAVAHDRAPEEPVSVPRRTEPARIAAPPAPTDSAADTPPVAMMAREPETEQLPEPRTVPTAGPGSSAAVPSDPDPAAGPAPPEPVSPTRVAAAIETSAPAARPPDEHGFTLKFESDHALRRLVARSEIGLYAIGEDRALRLNANRGGLSFWPASQPARYHEMDEATVPGDVVRALRRAGTNGPVTWGVTLPPRLSGELNRFLGGYAGGTLIIGSDGVMRREPRS